MGLVCPVQGPSLHVWEKMFSVRFSQLTLFSRSQLRAARREGGSGDIECVVPPWV